MSSLQDQKPHIMSFFSSCTDPRKCRIRHDLVDIIVIVILGTLCGEDGWEGFVDWAKDKLGYLQRFLKLSGGIPSPDTFRRVMERLDPQEFLQAFVSWADKVNQRLAGQVCIDGKVLRKAMEEGGALHLVSAWCESNSFVMGAIKASSKSNEIPAIEKLLDILTLQEGDIVTIDAIGCQKKIVSKIKEQKADYVIALKKNQQTLWNEVDNYFCQACEAPLESACQQERYEELGRGRHDLHKVWVTQEIDWLPQKDSWSGLKSLVMVKRFWKEGSKEKNETRYYISSLTGTAERLSNLIRRHWSIENEYHWHLDVTFGEDASSIGGKANENLRVARNVALSLLRNEKTFKRGLKAKMRRCHRSDEYLHQVLMLKEF